MLKMALSDCAINEKCYSVDAGRGICPHFLSPPWGIWQFKSLHPREFAIQGKKNANVQGSAGAGGIDWCITIITPWDYFFTNVQNCFYKKLMW